MEESQKFIREIVDDFFKKKNISYIQDTFEINIRENDNKYFLELVTGSSVVKQKLINTVEDLEKNIKEKLNGKFAGIEIQFDDNLNQKPQIKEEKLHPNLNDEFTFDTFVVADFNREAYFASKKIAENPGGEFNPLFIFGGYGIGKTHLATAIGHAIYKKFPSKKIHLTSPNELMSAFVKYTRENNTTSFSENFSRFDVLIVDDIQTFSKNWEKTENEFFNLFNNMLNKKKQLVFTSDVLPEKLDGLTERLKSRLVMGVIVDIKTPDTETKMKIIRAKIKQKNITPFTNDAIEFLAKHSPDNIRDMLGYLNRINLYSQIRNIKTVTTDDVADILKDFIKLGNEDLTIQKVVETVAETFSIKLKDLKSKSRQKSIAEVRHLAVYMCREVLDCSFTEIGEFFNRNHSTIINSCKIIEQKTKDNKEFNLMIKRLSEKLKKG